MIRLCWWWGEEVSLPPLPPAAHDAADIFNHTVDVLDRLLALDTAQAYRIKGLVLEYVRVLERPGTRGDARLQGLQLLAAGTHCGAMDATLLFAAGHPLDPDPQGETEEKLMASLSRARETARTQWPDMPADDMHLLAGYGKHENRDTANETEDASRRPLPSYQLHLLATFKAGYAVGLIDAAIVLLGGQRPDRV
ncbi:MAG: hypothetical protein ACYCW6_00865 [Candidatus Xenobia bacterium]